jgi:ABC-2 type transport system ATP-binding protein
MIEIKNVSKSYTPGKKAVDTLDLKIDDGEIFGFLGPNGAGKTTTIKMMTGISRPDEGDIFIDGKSILTNPLEAKKAFGYVPDNPDMFLKLSGIEYLNFMADVYEVPSEVRKDRIKYLVEKFEMQDSIGDKIQSYSHGMRQKIVLIGVLVHEPKNWILDEPMTGLDPKSAYTLKQMMREHAQKGYTVFFSTHVLEVAEKLCDKVGIINKGKLVVHGTYEEIKNKFSEEKSLENIFLEITNDGQSI